MLLWWRSDPHVCDHPVSRCVDLLAFDQVATAVRVGVSLTRLPVLLDELLERLGGLLPVGGVLFDEGLHLGLADPDGVQVILQVVSVSHGINDTGYTSSPERISRLTIIRSSP